MLCTLWMSGQPGHTIDHHSVTTPPLKPSPRMDDARVEYRDSVLAGSMLTAQASVFVSCICSLPSISDTHFVPTTTRPRSLWCVDVKLNGH